MATSPAYPTVRPNMEECMMISSHEVLQKEKKDRQESYYKRTRLIREGKLKPMPESRMSSYGPVRDMSIKLSTPKFDLR